MVGDCYCLTLHHSFCFHHQHCYNEVPCLTDRPEVCATVGAAVVAAAAVSQSPASLPTPFVSRGMGRSQDHLLQKSLLLTWSQQTSLTKSSLWQFLDEGLLEEWENL